MPQLSFDKTKNQEYEVPCKRCDGLTWHKVLTSVENEIRHEEYQADEEFQIVYCQGCREISFRQNSKNSEDFTVENDQFVYDDHIEIFPSRIAGRKLINGYYYLPNSVQKIYKETHGALLNQYPLLAGIGIRALVESICNEKKVTGKDLEIRIDNLVEKNVLTKEGAEILHSTRLMGNKSAHDILPESDSNLSVAMDVVEHLLSGVYILPERAANLPKRKIKSNAKES